MSLYASVTGIKWDFSGATVAGGAYVCVAECVLPYANQQASSHFVLSSSILLADIIVPAKQLITRFEIDPTTERFAAANALWDQIDDAFEDIDTSL